jgi:uncharacterized protein YndB with AHSA1/START domain
MNKLTFTIEIAASCEKVWRILWDDETYRKWTAVFHEGSHAVSDWQLGSKVLFLGPDGNGMVSRIAQLEPNKTMIFEHLGEVKNGVEEVSAAWAGAQEAYHLAPKDDHTELTVLLDAHDEYAGYFTGTFPKAMDIVKALSEN